MIEQASYQAQGKLDLVSWNPSYLSHTHLHLKGSCISYPDGTHTHLYSKCKKHKGRRPAKRNIYCSIQPIIYCRIHVFFSLPLSFFFGVREEGGGGLQNCCWTWNSCLLDHEIKSYVKLWVHVHAWRWLTSYKLTPGLGYIVLHI